MPEILLNLSTYRARSRVNGPGVRSVVWVQGCTIGCPGCFNPHTHAHEPRKLVDPVQLGRELAGIPGCDGITISGGEPFQQAQACSLLAECVRAAGRSVMVFSGYPYAYLKSSTDAAIHRFLGAVDLLVAGPYVAALKSAGSFWRASTNQKLHFLTDRLLEPVQSHERKQPIVEISVSGQQLISTGFPDEQDREWLLALAAGKYSVDTGQDAR